MTTTAPALGVTRYVAEVRGRFGWFRVFRTGSDRHYLFSAIDEHGCATGLAFPVRKTDLRADVRSALHNGWGHARPTRTRTVHHEGYGDWGMV